MKIYQWIDKYNYKNSLKILSRYSEGLYSGKSIFYSLNPKFWGKYLLRLLLVFASTVTFQKSAYSHFLKIISSRYSPFYSADTNPVFYIKLRDLIATLFGFRYFVDEQTLPLLPEKEIKYQKLNFDVNPKPEVSIIINNCFRLDYLFNCLTLIKDNGKDQNFEVILLNNNENRFINNFLKNISGVKIISVANDVTYIELAKVVTDYVKGKYLHLINCDVQPKGNWLSPLIKILNENDFGAAGSKIISPSGLLRNTGNFINQHPIGVYEHIKHPSFNFQREVDFNTSNSLMLSKADFLKLDLGNLSSKNTSNFGQEIGFALKNKLNKISVYQPLSEVISFSPLKNSIPNATQTVLPKAQIKSILFIDDEIPAPDQDSGSNRIFQIMLLVKSLGYHVVFMPVTGIKREGYFEQMVYAGFEVLYQFPNRKGMIKILLKKMPEIEVAWLCKPHNNEQFKFIFDANKNCKWIYDTIDLHFLRMQREADLSKSETIMQEADATKELEINIAKQADVTLAITDDEKIILKKEGIQNVAIIPNIHQLRIDRNAENSCAERDGLLFIGGYLHKPNIDAAIWLVKEIMPIVWKSIPTLKVTLLGSNPTNEVLKLQSECVNVPGYIHDVSSYFNNSKIFVAPLRFGAGMKGKIGQSLEFGLPIVSTDIGVEGIGLVDNENVIVANDTIAFADKIVSLYNNEALWNKIRNNSLKALRAYNPEVVREKIKALLEN